MNKEVIAVVRLAPGQAGYYDDMSRIHLTVGAPEAKIFAGTNCSQLRRSVQAGRLRLVSGSFGPEVAPFKLVRDGNRFLLKMNDAKADSFPKAAEIAGETKAVEKAAEKLEDKVAEVKGAKVEDGGDVKEAKPEKVKKDKAPAKETAADEDADKKPAKKTTKKAAAKKAE